MTTQIILKVIKLCTDHNMIAGIHEVIDGTNTKARARIVGGRDDIYVEAPDSGSKKTSKTS